MKKSVIVVCGPTAGGKSDLADCLAERLSERSGSYVPVVVVDSMQVYSGIEEITNQARRRPARLVSIIPVTERWTVARHATASLALLSHSPDGAILDAGTGMYLNAILLDLPLAPRVSPRLREKAEEATVNEANPRRAARTAELEMSGADERASIWSGDLRYETTILYLRPERRVLDASISERSKGICASGLEEARMIRRMQREGHDINPSVLESVGVAEMLQLADREITPEEARDKISARTRRLARKQLRWFDKLVRTVEGRAKVRIIENPDRIQVLNTMHDIMVK